MKKLNVGKERHSRESGSPSGRRARLKRWMDSRFRGNDGESGFTLVELMVVIVIIGLLATVVIINVLPATDKAAITKAKADVGVLEQGVELYRLNKLRYPSGSEGLQAVLAERFVKRLPKDPWGNAYVYAAPGRDGREFDIYSFGADGREGGEGQDSDIGNWDS